MTPPQKHAIYEQYEGTALWRALEGALADPEASREARVGTAPHHVLGYRPRSGAS